MRQRYNQARNITLIGAVTNLIQAIIKFIFGWLGHSHALVADGIHSFADLLTDALVLLASFFGNRKADWDHPYGHRRIETAGSLFLALLLIVAGLAIGWDALGHIFYKSAPNPHAFVLLIALISIMLNEILFQYTLRIGNAISSNLIIANAWHHRSDALSSIVVLLGVAGALMGFPRLDAVAAIIVGGMVIKMGIEIGWSSVRELVDTGVPADVLAQIRASILSVPGVLTLHQLRTRCMAENILVDAHILVSPNLSVSEGHYIASKVHQTLMNSFSKINDVTIHVDSENDEFAPQSLNLPPRQEVLSELMAHWLDCPGVEYIQDVTLHYLQGKITVHLYLPLQLLNEGYTAKMLNDQYNQVSKHLKYVKWVNILFQ